MKKLLFCLFIVATLIFIFTAIIVLHETNWTYNFELFIAISITLVTFTTMLWLGHYFINWFPIIIYLAIILIVLCSLFPPWYRTVHAYGAYKRYVPIGYSFIASPPERADGIDVRRLSVEYAAIIVPALGLLYLFRKGKAHLRTSTRMAPDSTPTKPQVFRSETVKVNRGGTEYKMRKPILIILLICVSIIIFALGAIFSYYVRPNRYKSERPTLDMSDIATLEQPAQQTQPQETAKMNLPEGFVLDNPPTANRFTSLLEPESQQQPQKQNNAFDPNAYLAEHQQQPPQQNQKPTFGQNDEVIVASPQADPNTIPPPPAGFTEEVNIATE
jgi:hypothetical protein